MELFEGLTDEGLKANESLKKFASVDDLTKSYLELEKYRGNSIALPGEGATDEDYIKIYDKLGRPQTAEGYKLDPIEGFPEGQGVNPEMEKQIKSLFHKGGLSNSQANKVFKQYISDIVLPQLKQRDEAEKKTLADAEVELRKEWGVEFDGNKQLALDGALKFADEKDKQFIREKLANDPRFIRMFNKIGKSFSEDKSANNMTQQFNKQTALSRINEIKADVNHPYWNARDARHEAAKAEFDKLHEIAYAAG